MRILIDVNRIIAAAMKDSTTRLILKDENFEFVTPDFTITEIEKHKERIKIKLKISDVELKLLLDIIFSYVTILPYQDYAMFEEEIKDKIKDPDDVAYVAACLASNAEAIWTHDPHFNEQKKVKVFYNFDMLKIAGKNRT